MRWGRASTRSRRSAQEESGAKMLGKRTQPHFFHSWAADNGASCHNLPPALAAVNRVCGLLVGGEGSGDNRKVKRSERSFERYDRMSASFNSQSSLERR